MATLKPAPIYERVAGEDGKATLPYALFFNSLFTGDMGVAWTPVFTNLTVVGAAPTITGRIYRISQSLAYFTIKIVPGTNTSSTAGSTYATGFPLTMKADGINFAVSGLLGTNSGMNDSATNRVYVPSWSAVTVTLTIIGMVEAS